MRNWVLVIYSNELKNNIVKVINVDSIKQIAYIINETPTDVSNFYHNITKPKNMFLFINLYKD